MKSQFRGRMRHACAVVAFTVAVCAQQSRAELLVDTFGEGGTYSNSFAQVPDSPIEHEMAAPFTIQGGDYMLTAVDMVLLAFVALFHEGMTATVSIYADDSGAPGTVLESQDLTLTAWADWKNGQLWLFGDPRMRFFFSGTTLLEGGKNYWLGIADGPDTDVGWMFTSNFESLPPTHFAIRQVGQSWQTGLMPQVTFRVYGDAVPAPGAMTFLLLGLCRRSRRRTPGS